MRQPLATIPLLAVLLATMAGVAWPSTPQAIKLQGYLSEYVSGQKQPADGTYTMTFDLYDAASGGTLIARDGPQAVEVRDGSYEAELHFDVGAFATTSRYIEVTVGAEVLAPRIHVVSTPYGYVADRVDGYEGADLEESDEIAAGDAQLQARVDALDNRVDQLETSAGGTLDEAYDHSGPGAGRTITADAGPVSIEGTGGLAMEIASDQGQVTWVHSTATQAAFVFEGALAGTLVGSSATTKDLRLQATHSVTTGAYVIVVGLDKDVFGTGEGSVKIGAAQNSPTGDILFQTGTVVRQVIDQDGEVGIGTLDPRSKLHVKGNGNVVKLEGSDHVYTEYFPDGYSGGRKAYVGFGSALNNHFSIKNEEPGGKVLIDNPVRVQVLEITGGGADLAERFDVHSDNLAGPGAVLVIDPAQPGQLQVSKTAYDRRVAGIVSGAGDLAPGITLTTEEPGDNGLHVAMAGRVWARATAVNGPIEPGDLLTTSDIAGHAMRVDDLARAQGAVIGKAMSGLEAGEGLVLVLVGLQ